MSSYTIEMTNHPLSRAERCAALADRSRIESGRIATQHPEIASLAAIVADLAVELSKVTRAMDGVL